MSIIRETHRFATFSLVALSAAIAGASPLPAPLHVNAPNVRISPAGTPFVEGANYRWVAVDGYPRRYIVYVPTSRVTVLRRGTPVVFFFHGAGGSAQRVLRTSGWREKAEAEGCIAVFGNGLPYRELGSGETHTHWNRLHLAATLDLAVKPPGYPARAPWPADDVAFTDAMLADVQSGLRVDPRRTYVAGFSNGGSMALRLAIERSEVFAAVGAAGAGGLGVVYDPPRKVPLCYAIGNQDGFLLDFINSGPDAPVPPMDALPLTYAEAFAIPAIHERFDNITATFGVPSEPDGVWELENQLLIRYGAAHPCAKAQGNTVLVSIQGDVAHEYPNGDDNPAGFDNTELFWRFFRQHVFPE